MKHVNPYLNFRGRTEEAFALYHSVFGGDAPSMVRYRDMGSGAAHEGDLIAHVALPIGAETALMGSDISEARADTLHVGNNVEIYIAADSVDEGQRLFDALAAGGTVTMPYEQTSWAERFGACIDPFGVHWTIDYTGEAGAGAA